MSPTRLPASEFEHLKLTEVSQDALAKAYSTYTHLNPSSLRAHQSARQHQPGGNTRTVLHANPFPLTFASGNGCTLTSLDGHTYIDFLGEYTAGIYGHNNAHIRAAIDEALTKGWSFGGNNMYEKELAKLVCERFTPTVELVRFTNSGTEANMMAVATAIAWTGRKKILVFRGGYHGATLSFRNPPKGSATKSVNLPHEWVVGTYNDIVQTEEVLSVLPPKSLAAILVEPMLGNAGAIPGSLPFLQFLRSTASSHDALLIFDEVMTSRLSYHGLGRKLGVQPDLMTLGKWLGGGMSFGAFGGRKDIMEMFDPSRSGGLAHAGTFNNNIISMAAGCAGCKILDEKTTNRLNDLGERLKEMATDVIEKQLYGEVPHMNGVDKGSLKGNVTLSQPSENAFKTFIDSGAPSHVDFKLTTNSTTDISPAPDRTSMNGTTNRTTNSTTYGTHSHSQHHRLSNGTTTKPQMYISGIGSILAIHFPPSLPHLQSLFYHHMLSKNIYLAERGFMALNIELGMEEVEKFVEATGEFVERFRAVILAC
ncbi:hypothetical protein MMC28_008765 [Mycoblastus sanguinarius]|nr:hypothetical protein [Mycoblastus sanguinarius]